MSHLPNDSTSSTSSSGPAAPASEPEIPLLRVLLIEDNEGDVRLMREYLSGFELARFEVEVVRRLSEAMDATRERSGRQDDYGIVLLDLSLPDGHGIESFAALAREAPHLPIVVLTGLDDDLLALRLVRAGAQDYLIKSRIDETTLPRALLYAAERHRVQSRLKALSNVDELTGLYNRRGFLAMAEQQLKAAERERRSLALFYTDLNGMKQINDRFGHAEGDWALQQAAGVLRQTFRETDVLARLGGDEFTVLAWMRSAEDIARVTTRLREHVDAVNAESGRGFALGISVGATFIAPDDSVPVEELLERADDALYIARRNKPRTGLPEG